MTAEIDGIRELIENVNPDTVCVAGLIANAKDLLTEIDRLEGEVERLTIARSGKANREIIATRRVNERMTEQRHAAIMENYRLRDELKASEERT